MKSLNTKGGEMIISRAKKLIVAAVAVGIVFGASLIGNAYADGPNIAKDGPRINVAGSGVPGRVAGGGVPGRVAGSGVPGIMFLTESQSQFELSGSGVPGIKAGGGVPGRVAGSGVPGMSFDYLRFR